MLPCMHAHAVECRPHTAWEGRTIVRTCSRVFIDAMLERSSQTNHRPIRETQPCSMCSGCSHMNRCDSSSKV